ncbi:MAG: methyltransferase domain-containing protein [Betaproteobacteria bacterium]
MQPGELSTWRDSQMLDEDAAREHAERLELRARAEDEIAVREEYLGLLGVKPGEQALDLGCGSGVVTRALAQRVTPGGRAVGLDISATLLGIARKLADESGQGDSMEFRQGDCRRLPFPDASFDVVFAATALAHVPEAERALPEMIRVARRGGRIGVFDFDADSVLIAHPDRELTRRIVLAYADYGSVNGWLMRALPGMLKDLGLVEVRARAFMPLESRGYYAQLAQRAADTALKAGRIADKEHREWTGILNAQIAAGCFLGGRLHLLVWGIRPL